MSFASGPNRNWIDYALKTILQQLEILNKTIFLGANYTVIFACAKDDTVMYSKRRQQVHSVNKTVQPGLDNIKQTEKHPHKHKTIFIL